LYREGGELKRLCQWRWHPLGVLGLVLSSKVGGSEIERAARTAPINGCEMDKRWFLN